MPCLYVSKDVVCKADHAKKPSVLKTVSLAERYPRVAQIGNYKIHTMQLHAYILLFEPNPSKARHDTLIDNPQVSFKLVSGPASMPQKVSRK